MLALVSDTGQYELEGVVGDHIKTNKPASFDGFAHLSNKGVSWKRQV
jgi:hypothetical protein